MANPSPILMFFWHPLPELHAAIGLAPFVVMKPLTQGCDACYLGPQGELFLVQLSYSSYKIMSTFQITFEKPLCWRFPTVQVSNFLPSIVANASLSWSR